MHASTQVDKVKRQAADAEAAARGSDQQARELAKVDSRAERERKAAEAEVRACGISHMPQRTYAKGRGSGGGDAGSGQQLRGLLAGAARGPPSTPAGR